MNKKFWIIILSVILLSGCGSNRYAKKGLEFENVGYYDKAAEMYYLSLTKNVNNVDAVIGLKKTGQLTLDKKLGQFLNHYNANLVKDAVYKYAESEKYYKKVKGIGIELNFPGHYKDYYDEMKSIYLEKIYNEAYLLLEDENFEKAETKFSEILLFEPDYGDVDELKKKAHYEPIYRKGMNFLNQEKYRSAYYEFHEILDNLDVYRDSKEQMDLALDNAILTISITDFNNLTRYKNIEQQLESDVEKKITEINSPFIKIVDRDNQEKITSEQLLTLEGKVDEATSSKAGRMLGVKALLTAEVQSYSLSDGELKKTKKKGFIKEVIKGNKEAGVADKTIYHKTNYYEYEQKKRVSCKFQFKLISTETSEVLVSDVVTMSADDNIHYAKYEGNSKNLVKGYWNTMKKDSPNDKVNDSASDNRALQKLLKATTRIKNIEQLKKEVNAKIADKVATKIKNYDPEK